MDNYAYQTEQNGRPFAISRYPSVHPQGSTNYLVEVNSRAKYLQKPKFYQKLSWGLTALLLIFIIALIILIVFYCMERQKIEICTSDECLRSAMNFKYSLDFEADPCDDFYRYTCGHWSKEHPNHGWFSSFSTFDTIKEKYLIASEEFLTSETESDAPLPVKQAKDFYASCMDTDSMNELGLSSVYKLLKLAELPAVPTLFTASEADFANFKFDWLRSDAVLKKVYVMDVFIGFVVGQNEYNVSENVMYLGTPGASCPLPSPLKRSPSDKINPDVDLRREANGRIIKFILRTVVTNATSSQPSEVLIEEATDVLLNMTQFINELIGNYSNHDSDKMLKSYSFRELEGDVNNFLTSNANKTYPEMFQTYVEHLFEGTNITIDTKTDLLYLDETEKQYLPKIFTYVLTTSDIYLELYMWWVAVFAMILNTTDDIVSEIFRQTAPFYKGQSVLRSRSLDCTDLTESFMAYVVSYGLADKTFANTTKPKVEQMIYEIKDAFVKDLKTITWMDKNTKAATLDKAKEMVSFIGYPKWLFKEGELEKRYEDVQMKNDTYLDNMMALITKLVPQKLHELRRINERTWRTDPITVNAFNSFTDNAINIPMAILNYPMYDLGLEVLNYGALGSILGHEIIHGFDNSGRKLDKFGNYKQWWTNETVDIFEEKTRCFIKQYENFTIDGIEEHVDGKVTLGENLADNGGLNLAFIAYQQHLKKFGDEKRLPGFENFTNSQLFFLSFASIWCETTSLENIAAFLKYDEHPPNNVRVWGVMQNSPHFSEAFSCPKGRKMNPDKSKCKIW